MVGADESAEPFPFLLMSMTKNVKKKKKCNGQWQKICKNLLLQTPPSFKIPFSSHVNASVPIGRYLYGCVCVGGK